MVKIRLTRFGERNRVCYRLVAVDSRKKTNGGYLELLGTYDPTPTKSKIKDSKFKFNKERIFSWLQNGAICSETVINALKKNGYWKEFLASKPQKDTKKKKRPKKTKKVKKEKKIKKTTKVASSTIVENDSSKVENNDTKNENGSSENIATTENNSSNAESDSLTTKSSDNVESEEKV